MATYTELEGLVTDADLLARCQTAIVIAAHGVLSEVTPDPQRVRWATSILDNPAIQGRRALWLVLAENKDQTVATIQAATDATLQTNVDEVVDALIVAYGA